MKLKIYTINKEEMIHITEFAQLLSRSVQSTRHLIEEGNRFRKLLFYRDRSRLMIPLKEVVAYPFTDSGRVSNNVYHYSLLPTSEPGYRTERYLCKECTYGVEPCALAKEMLEKQKNWDSGDL